MKYFAAAAVATLFLVTSALAEEETTVTTTTTTTKKKDKKDKEKEKEKEHKGEEGEGHIEAHRSSGGSANYSLISAQTVGADRNFIHVQAGWPGLVGSFIHGQNESFDIGGKFGLMWGQEAVSAGYIGLRGQFVMRWLLAQIDIARLGLEFEPGIQGYFVGLPYFGIILPVKFTVAFPITSALTLSAGADIPLSLNFGTGFFFATIPILFGGGVEYVINETLSINARLRLGPAIYAGNGAFGAFGAFGFGAPVGLGVEGMAGLAIHI